MFKIKAIMQMANKAMERILDGKNLKYHSVKPPDLCSSSSSYYRRNKWNRRV